MDFLILRPLSPKTGYHFFEGGGWGGSKVFAQMAPSSGEAYRCHTTAGRMVMQFSVGGSNPGRPNVGGGSGAIFAGSEFALATKRSALSCITIRPLLALQ